MRPRLMPAGTSKTVNSRVAGSNRNNLISSDGIQPDGSIRMHAHRVTAGGAAFEFRQLINVELFGLGVIAQPSAIGTAVYEPQLSVRSTVNGVETIGWRLPGGRRNLRVAKSFGIETAKLSAYSLGDPAVSFQVHRYLVRLGFVVGQFIFHGDIFGRVAFEESPGQTAIGVRRRLAAPAATREIRHHIIHRDFRFLIGQRFGKS